MKKKSVFTAFFFILLSFLSCGNSKTGSENNNENPDSEIINESEWSARKREGMGTDTGSGCGTVINFAIGYK